MKRSRTLVAGLTICALLGVLDIVGLAGLGIDGGPPAAVAIGGGILGIITLAAAVPAWRGSRAGLLTVVVSRVISVLLGVPVFFADQAPDWARVVVGIAIAATIIGVALLAVARRQPPTAAAQ